MMPLGNSTQSGAKGFTVYWRVPDYAVTLFFFIRAVQPQQIRTS